jgi:phage nucleotide-binding protein
MAFQLIKANEVKEKSTLNVLLYGAPGVGKTTFAATTPKPMILNLEGGEKSIMDQDIDLANCQSIDDVRDAVSHAINNGYKTLVFDSLTRYCEMLMDEIVKDDKKKKPQIQHWGELNDRIKRMIYSLQKKDINTVLIAHVKEIEEDGRIVKRPYLNGGLMQSISGIVDVVGYLYVTNRGDRLLSVNPKDNWYAKHRTIKSNRIKEDLEPDFSVLENRIFCRENKKIEGNEKL